ncbi:hypothetical protein GCM10009006_36470 [Haloarcula argentinensis]|uniref:Uncharacterized protein n=1 Tax=Haloarcula argentinensis TaxID=43776 RepID=A0A830FX67_HALAR|nr:hypothetical protein GCM10009006_36470 [Haloarcula argentinensis]
MPSVCPPPSANAISANVGSNAVHRSGGLSNSTAPIGSISTEYELFVSVSAAVSETASCADDVLDSVDELVDWEVLEQPANRPLPIIAPPYVR